MFVIRMVLKLIVVSELRGTVELSGDKEALNQETIQVSHIP